MRKIASICNMLEAACHFLWFLCYYMCIQAFFWCIRPAYTADQGRERHLKKMDVGTQVFLFKVVRRSAIAAFLASTTALVSVAQANPQGGQVVGGSATIVEAGKTLDIHQQSARAVIDWRRFDIAPDEHTRFHQPSASAIAVNRVKDGNPSSILGKLSGNGNVVLVNPSGVFFGAGATVDVNGLIATTADIRSSDFMAGSDRFDIPGRPGAAIVNAGRITAKEAGLVGLVAPTVENHGVIEARLGRVHLASGDTLTADFYGDGLLKVEVAEGREDSRFVGNTGILSAEGGTVAMTVAAARETVDSLIVAKGELKAPSVSRQGGKIIIAAEGANKTSKKGGSAVVVQAHLDASGRDAGERGGSIEILGDHVALLDGTVLDASGHSSLSARTGDGTATMTAEKAVRSEAEFMARDDRAGGSIKVGGDYLGRGETQTAKTLFVGGDVLTLNDAVQSGDAGRTVFWSDDTTDFGGLVLARGGLEGGNGGFLETSGKINLRATGFADMDAEVAGYAKGTYLLDPASITIHGNFDPTSLTGLQLWLDGNDVNGDGVDNALANGTAVSQWVDKSANRYVANAVSGKDAFINADAAASGRDVVGFNNDELRIANFNAIDNLTGLTYFYVGRRPTANASQVAVTTNLSNIRIHAWDANRTAVGANGSNAFNAYQNQPHTSWTQVSAVYDGTQTGNQNRLKSYFNGAQGVYDTSGGTIQATTGDNSTLFLGQWAGAGYGWVGDIAEVIAYDDNFTTDQRNLVEQYQAVKWGLTLDPVSGAGTEAAEAMGSTGYSAFTTRYLEKLSSSADIVLQADSAITLDLKGDTLSLANGRNISLQTANGSIQTASAGTISTSKSGASGGNISFTAGGSGSININHALTLNAQNGGAVSLTALGGGVNIGAGGSLTLPQGDLTVRAPSFSALGAINANTIWSSDTFTSGAFGAGVGSGLTLRQDTASRSLAIGSGGTEDTQVLDSIVNAIKAGFSNYTFGREDGGAVANRTSSWDDAVSFLTGGTFTNAISSAGASTILAKAGGDISLLAPLSTSSSAAHALVLSAQGNFLNTAGANALSASSSRWIVYSAGPANNARNGLLPMASEFGKSYALNAPGTIGAGNRFVYATSVRPVLSYRVANAAVEYGEAFTAPFSAVYTGGLAGDDSLSDIGQSGAPTYAANYTAGTGAGVVAGALTASLGSLADPLGYDYAFAAGDLTVNKAVLTVSLAQAQHQRMQGGANPAFGLVYNGFKLGQSETVLATAPTATTAAGIGAAPGFYDISIAGGSDANYSFAYANPAGALEVVALPPSPPPSSPPPSVLLPTSWQKTVYANQAAKPLLSPPSPPGRTVVVPGFTPKYKIARHVRSVVLPVLGVRIEPRLAEVVGLTQESADRIFRP